MIQPNTPAVGIDLGTTFCVVARLDPSGRPVTIPNAEGDLITPSAVLFDGDDVVVGKEAVKALANDALRVAECPKRSMGLRHYGKTLNGQLYPPEVIQAYILRNLAGDARRQVGDFRQAVITVPAYFDEVRRKATQDAGYMAGLDVLDIINEPTAAALAFGFEQGFLSPGGQSSHHAPRDVPRGGESRQPQKILVYDLGGGTFDITLMELSGAQFTALATDGDFQLGGRDWDQRIVNHVAEEFQRRHGLDPRQDPNAAGRLWRDCQDAKRTLSARKNAAITCEFQGRDLRVDFTREQFLDLTRDLLERTQFTTREILKTAKLDWGSIARILMVGGSTRMPMVADMLRNLSGKEPDCSVSADEAVAHGAALHAGLILSQRAGRPPAFQVRNVNSHSLGIVGTHAETGRKRNVTVIPRNTPLPVAAKRTFTTQVAGQNSILVQIVEGESTSPADCTAIGQCIIRDLPADLPARTPIEVRFRYAADGRLAISVQVAGTDVQLSHEIQRENSLSQEQLDAWRTRVCRTGPP